VSKACSKCGEVQPLSAFSPDTRYQGGYRRQCRTCVNTYSAARRAKLPKSEPKPRQRIPAEVQAASRREYQREWRAEWRRNNPEMAREQWRKYETSKTDYLTQWRKTQDT
jgi:hypothetical protein